MSLLTRFRRLVDDPPPASIFELSADGIAWARAGRTLETGFRPLAADVLSVSPVRDNVVRPDQLLDAVKALAPANGSRNRARRTALILPDYCARVAVLDFDSFPSDRAEQLSLVRFRMKKTVPFDLESAVVSLHAQPAAAKKIEVVVAVASLEIVARYEAPFRAAGFQPGFATTSMLAALELLPRDGLAVAAKLGGKLLTVAVADSRKLKLLRSVELADVTAEEIMAVLFPTFAYAEDEMAARPQRLLVCGFGPLADAVSRECRDALALDAEPLRARHGAPDGSSAGLFGFLEGAED